MAYACQNGNVKNAHELKMKAMKYYEENGVPKKMEEALNSMFFEEPEDVYSYLVDFFSKLIKPATISKLLARKETDSSGMPIIQTQVFCSTNNKEKMICSCRSPCPNLPETNKEQAEIEIQQSILSAVETINSQITEKLAGLRPTQQKEIDDILRLYYTENLAKVSSVASVSNEEFLEQEEAKALENAAVTSPAVDEKNKNRSAKGKSKVSLVEVIPDKPPEVFAPGSEMVTAVSQAVCTCAAKTDGIALYRYIAKLAREKGALNEFRIPLPVVTILHGGKFGQGKAKCVKDFMVVPGISMSLNRSLNYIMKIYSYVAKTFATKLGNSARLVDESGALCVPIDSPTQGLDVLHEAINSLGLTVGEDMYIILNAAGSEYFDYDKGKYEPISGTMKSPDDMVEFWADIVTKNKSVLGIIDPFRNQDSEAWLKLCERVSQSIFIIGDRFYDRPGLIVDAELPNPSHSSVYTMNLERLTTITDIINCTKKMTDLNNELMVSTNNSETTDSLIVDLAVGLNARFLKVGGPYRGERSNKLKRLREIYGEMELPEIVPVIETEESLKSESIVKSTSASAHEHESFSDKQVPVQKDSTLPSNSINNEEEKSEYGLEMQEELVDDSAQETLYGDFEKSKLVLHTPFTFTLIQKPPPPPIFEGENGNETESQSEKNSTFKA